MALYLALAIVLLSLPFSRHSLEKRAIDLPIELVYVHGMHSRSKPIVLGPQPADGRLVLALLVGVTGAESGANPSKDLLVK